MDNTVSVTYERMKDKAANLRSKADSIQYLLDDVSKVMNNTVGDGKSWDSAAAQNTKAKFTALAGEFNKFYNQINAYSRFIDNTVASYQQADVKVGQAADEFFS